VFWSVCEDFVDEFVRKEIQKLQSYEQEAISLKTPEGEAWWLEGEEDREKYPFALDDTVDYVSGHYVLSAAADWGKSPNPELPGSASFDGVTGSSQIRQLCRVTDARQRSPSVSAISCNLVIRNGVAMSLASNFGPLAAVNSGHLWQLDGQGRGWRGDGLRAGA
jgi:hypothetical protein